MIEVSLVGAAVGATAGLGLLLVASAVARRSIRLDDRVVPYLRAFGGELGPRTGGSALAPWMSRITRWLERLGSSRADVERRLARAGNRGSVEQFRMVQVVWAVVGLAAGLALSVLLLAARGSSLLTLVVLVVICAVAGILLCDWNLTRQASRREERIRSEFPTVAELLALAVGAGEGPVAAIDRIAATTRGDLSDEFTRVRADLRAGATLDGALEELGRRTEVKALARFAEAVTVAVDRGTPLAEVLRAQAQDVREAGRRALMEEGGRREVLMMIPVVFLILPVTVVFAVFPSLATLRVGL
ncbi:tight adherence protein C [Paraoerskovia marina]|uniref:Tight adherence protein C n=1 Tax=Paraoerskovia marina TaxID=545619 RepID=A0A1H1UHJ0_9CELL|nr:type II secretion system F family protein [Paraoerskovia marina]SDS71898.1 tight adherence protein C [Paraoerskovia marina]